MDEFVDLDVVGALESADKSSSYHLGWDYLRHYETLFAPYRHANINILEIGVFQGASLRIWKWFFPNARIVGIDINETCRTFAADRAIVEIGSQTDAAFLHGIADRYPPTIIIDDGSHVDDHMIFSFEQLLPKLAPGGLYVVEDIVHKVFREPRPNAAGKPVASAYFLDIAASSLAGGDLPQRTAIPAFVMPMIDRVTCFEGAICLHKRDPQRDTGRAAATAAAYIGQAAPTPAMLVNYAEWLCLHGAPPPLVLATLAALPDESRQTARAKILYADTLHRLGRTAEAQAAAATIPARDIKQPPVLVRLAALQLALGDPDAAKRTHAHAKAGTISNVIRRKWARVMGDLIEPGAE